MKLCYKSLLASLLLCMPLGTMQAAAEIGLDNIYQILSGIEDLQDGTVRTLDQVQELVNDTIENTNFIQVLCTMPKQERTQLLNDFNITLVESPQDDDYSDEEDAEADPDGEVLETPKLPKKVLELLLLELGFVDESGNPLTWLYELPPELIALVLNFNSQYTLDLADAMALSELSKAKPILLKRPDGSPVKACVLCFREKDKCIFVISGDQVKYKYDYRGALLSQPQPETKPEKHLNSKNEPMYLAKQVTDDTTIWLSSAGFQYLLDKDKQSIDLLGSNGNSLTCLDLTCSPDKRYIVAWDQNHLRHLFDNKGNRCELTDPNGVHLICRNIAWNNEMHYFAAHTIDNLCHLFTIDRAHITTLTDRNGNNLVCQRVICTSDGNILVKASLVALWNGLEPDYFRTYLFDNMGNLLTTLSDIDGNGLRCNRSELSPNGTYIATIIWQESNFFCIFDNRGILHKMVYVPCARWFKFSPDEQYLWVVNEQGTCYLYNIPKDQISTLMDIKENQIISRYTHRGEFSRDGHCLLIHDIDDHCYVFTVTEHKNIQYQLKRGITTDALLMLKLLGGLKKNWEQDYPHVPFSTCPADITCALISPLFSEIDFEKTKASQIKERVKQVHIWVHWTLESLKKIQLAN